MNKYRPKIFSEVIGQEFTKKVLSKHLQKKEYSSAYMFEGPYGSGKCVDGGTIVYVDSGVFEFSKLWKREEKLGKVVQKIDTGETIEFSEKTQALDGFDDITALYRERANCYRTTLENGMSLKSTSANPILILEEGLLGWKKLVDLSVGDVVALSPMKVDQNEVFSEVKIDRIIKEIKDYKDQTRLNHAYLLEMNKRALQQLLKKLLKEFGSRIDLGRNVVYAEVLQNRAFDVGVLLHRRDGVIIVPKDVFSLIQFNDANFDWTRKAESILDRELIYSLGRTFSEIIRTFNSDDYVLQGMEKVLRQVVQTRAVLRKVLKVLDPYVERNKQKLEWSPELFERYQVLKRTLEQRLYYAKVERFDFVGQRWMYDFVIPKNHHFKASSFVSHNTTLARIFSRATLCENRKDIDPCNKCKSCEESLAGRHPDLIEINAADHNSIDDVRKIKDRVLQKSWSGSRKIFILDEAHDLSSQAWDALLKILEEAGVDLKTLFVFCTTEIEKIPKTIISRSRILPIALPTPEETISFLKKVASSEGTEYEDKALYLIARMSEYHLRDAVKELSVLSDLGLVKHEEILKYMGFDIKKDLFEILIKLYEDPKEALEITFKKLNSRFSCYEVLDRLKKILTEIVAKSIGLSSFKYVWLEESDDSMVNRISQIYGDSLSRVMEYIFSSKGHGYTEHEMVLDFLVVNQILKKRVEFSQNVAIGKIVEKVDVTPKENLSSEEMTDIKRKMKDVGFLWALAKKPQQQDRKKEESKEVEITGDQLLADLGLK